MAVLAFTLTLMYGVIALAIVPRLAHAAQAEPRVVRAASWGAAAFFLGCALTHAGIGLTAISAADQGGAAAMPGMTGMGQTGSMSTASMLLVHVLPHVAQILGGGIFIAIASRRFEWAVVTKEAAERLRERESQFRSAFEQAPVGMALIDVGAPGVPTILQVNPALAALLDREAGQTRGEPYEGLFAAADRDIVTSGLRELLAGGPGSDEEVRLLQRDGRRIWVDVRASVVRDADTTQPYAVVTIRDVTAKRQAATLRSAQYAVARTVSEAASVDAGLADVVREVSQHLGWAGGEYWHVNVERDVIERTAAWWSPQFAGTPVAVSNTVMLRRGEGLPGAVWSGGSPIWVGDIAGAASASTTAQAAVGVGLNAAIGLPIRSREQAGVLIFLATDMAEPDSALSSSLDAICAHVARFVERCRADEFRRLVESSPDAMMIADAAGRIVTLNSQTELMFGRSREQLLGELVDVLVPGQFGPGPHESSRPRGETGHETQGRRSDGTSFPLEISRSSVDADGETLVSLSVRDLTERRRAEDVRLLLAAIVDSSDDAMVGSTLDGTITSWNRAAEETLGYTAAEATGASITTLLFEADQDAAQEMLGRIQRGERVEHRDAVCRCRDGRRLDVSMSVSAIRDANGTLVGASQVIRDITVRKQAEYALDAAKEAAEVSSRAFEAFSYSVAHDLRAPLRAMAGFTQVLDEDYREVLDERGRGHLQRVGTAVRQMAQLIDSLLELARVTHREITWEPVDLSAIATRTLTDLAAGSPGRVVDWVVQPGLSATGDPALVANVLENLLANAWKFTRDRSTARIEFGRDGSGFVVADNGAGFDMAYADKLFVVFQRLHNPSEFEGTGIGLATVARIVERHGGRIWAEGAVGEGATFHFTLSARRASQD